MHGGVIIRTKAIKIISLAVMVGIIVPTNIFGYGTSDISYIDKVSSTVEISELQIDNKNYTRNINKDSLIPTDLADALSIGYSDDENKSLILGDELASYDIVLLSDKSRDELEETYSGLSNLCEAKISNYMVVDLTNSTDTDTDVDNPYELFTKEPLKSYREPSYESEVINEYQQNIKILVTSIERNGFILLDNGKFDEWIEKDLLCTQSEYIKSLQGSALLDIDNPDTSYNGTSVELTDEDRDLLERLVMGEAGAEGYEGAALVAQCIRDTMVYKEYKSVAEVRNGCKYSGSISKEPNKNVKDAVAFIFDEGGYAVRHKIFYFYAYKWCKSSWHETQPFVIQYGGHRFFDSK